MLVGRVVDSLATDSPKAHRPENLSQVFRHPGRIPLRSTHFVRQYSCDPRRVEHREYQFCRKDCKVCSILLLPDWLERNWSD